MSYEPAARRKWAESAKKLGPDAAADVDAYVAGIKAGRIKTLPMPWINLTNLSRALVPGTITMMYGTGGFGKSLFLLQLSYSLFAAGVPIRVYMLENDHRKHCTRLYCQLAENAKLDDTDWVEQSNGQVEAAMGPHRDAIRAFGARMSTSLSARVSYGDLLEWIKRGCDEGVRFFAIDPITHASQNDKPWLADPKFIDSAREHLERTHASLFVMTHPTKHDGRKNSVATMSGSKAFFDFTDCVLRLERPEKEVAVRVKTDAGSYIALANRVMAIEKARNGRGTGMRVGMRFDDETFKYKELGVVTKDAEKAKARGYDAPATQAEPDPEDVSNLFAPTSAKPWLQRQSDAPPGEPA